MTEQQQRKTLARLGWVVIIMAVIFVAQGVYYTWEARQQAECQFQVNSEFKQQVLENRQTANEARQALIDFLTALQNDSTGNGFDQARKEYLRITQEQQDEALRQAQYKEEWLKRC